MGVLTADEIDRANRELMERIVGDGQQVTRANDRMMVWLNGRRVMVERRDDLLATIEPFGPAASVAVPESPALVRPNEPHPARGRRSRRCSGDDGDPRRCSRRTLDPLSGREPTPD